MQAFCLQASPAYSSSSPRGRCRQALQRATYEYILLLRTDFSCRLHEEHREHHHVTHQVHGYTAGMIPRTPRNKHSYDRSIDTAATNVWLHGYQVLYRVTTPHVITTEKAKFVPHNNRYSWC